MRPRTLGAGIIIQAITGGISSAPGGGNNHQGAWLPQHEKRADSTPCRQETFESLEVFDTGAPVEPKAEMGWRFYDGEWMWTSHDAGCSTGQCVNPSEDVLNSPAVFCQAPNDNDGIEGWRRGAPEQAPRGHSNAGTPPLRGSYQPEGQHLARAARPVVLPPAAVSRQRMLIWYSRILQKRRPGAPRELLEPGRRAPTPPLSARVHRWRDWTPSDHDLLWFPPPATVEQLPPPGEDRYRPSDYHH